MGEPGFKSWFTWYHAHLLSMCISTYSYCTSLIPCMPLFHLDINVRLDLPSCVWQNMKCFKIVFTWSLVVIYINVFRGCSFFFINCLIVIHSDAQVFFDCTWVFPSFGLMLSVFSHSMYVPCVFPYVDSSEVFCIPPPNFITIILLISLTSSLLN